MSFHKFYGDVRPLPKDVLVIEMERGYRKENGIIFLDDSHGDEKNIKPRWCKVYAVGEQVDDVKKGDWVLVEHGRWTYGLNVVLTSGEEVYLQKIDPNSILITSDEKPNSVSLRFKNI